MVSIRRLRLLAAVSLTLAAAPALAQSAPTRMIYSCIDADGKRQTSDRPIAECNAREQRVLNPDGSVKRVVPPNMTPAERAEAEAREREAQAEKAARLDAIRRDRNLMSRYPNAAAHQRAREAALDDTRNAVRLSEARVKLLTAERKPLLAETEFYAGKPLPAKLKAQLDANDAALEAQRTLIQNQEAEVVRINALYDAELERLKQLWAGSPPGSLGASAALAEPRAVLR